MKHRFWLIAMAVLVSAVGHIHAQNTDPALTLQWQGVTIETGQDIQAMSRSMGMRALSDADAVYYFVQFTGPITRDMKSQVTQAGGELLTYVPTNAYITRISSGNLTTIRNLDVVQWVGVYQPALRLSANMRSLVLGERPPAPSPREFTTPAPADDRILVTVRLFPGADVAAIEQAARDAGGEVLDSASRERGAVLRVRMTPAQVTKLAAASGVMLIEEFSVPRLLNDQGRNVMDVTPVATTLGLQGNGQVVGIADSGIDSGVNDATMHADLAGRIVAINSWPVQVGYGATNPGADDGAADVDGGHGTHTTGSFVGNGSFSGNLYRGTAPQASVVFQAIEQWTSGPGGNSYALTGIPLDLNPLFQQAYDNGARIHSNSWGSPDAGAYTATSEDVDEFVWNNRDMLIVFSAGNEGVDTDTNNVVDPDSIGSPGTAKNALTVGASENNRPTIPQTWAPSYGPVIDADQQANNSSGLAAFSSRGPTDDGRIKPDMVAPGTMVASIRSQASPNTVWFTDNMEGGVNGWTGQGTWGQVTNFSNSATTSWHDSPAGNYASGANISLMSPTQNLSGGGQGGKSVQFFARYALGAGDQVWLEASNDGGATWPGALPIFQGTQPNWELTTIGLGPFSNAANFRVRLRLQADGDASTGDGVYVDDFRITEGAFGTALMSDFGIETAGSVNDTNYMLSNGTSMATPLTAGAAAIARQYYTDIVGVSYVSAARLRATLVNGAVDISPGQYGAGANQEIAAAPDNAQGWGRVSLEQSLLPTAPAQLDFIDELAGLETGENRNYELVITNTTVPARITMVYHDFPGAALVNNLDMTVAPPGGGATLFPNGLAAADNVNNVERIVIPAPVAGTYTIQVNGQNVPEGPQPYALVTSAGGSITDRNPVDVMLVLDISGSMLSPGCPGCDPKLDVLQDAVELFVQLFTAVAVSTDRLGVMYFRTNIDEFEIGGNVLLDVIPNAAAIISDVRGQASVPANLTAMGGGVQTAIAELTDATRPRSIVVFTDGMQNVNPMVLNIDDSPPPGTFHLEIDDLPGRTSSGVAPTTPPTQLDTALNIKVNTIGVGTSTPFEQMLADMASETGGLTKLTTAPDNDLRRFFVEELIDALRDFSPQLVDYRQNTLAGDNGTEVFSLNDNAHQIVFKLSWPRGAKLDYRVEKNGVDLTRFGRLIAGPFYQIFTLDLPANVHGTPVVSGGDWELHISGMPDTPYDAAAIVDEDQLGYTLSLSQDIAAGDPIELGVRLQAGSRPITDATVSARVLKPGASLGSLLATTALPSGTENFEPNSTVGQQKVQVLMQDPNFHAQLQPVDQSIALQSNNDGTYSATYTDTSLTGSYTVVFELEGNHAVIGSFQRTEKRSTVVHFGEPDFANSDVRIVDQETDPPNQFVKLQIRPRDRLGNFLGPDYGHRINYGVSAGTVSQEILDPGDGTYLVTLTYPEGADPEVAIDVLGGRLFDGYVSELDTEKPPPLWLWILLVIIVLLLIIYLLRRN